MWSCTNNGPLNQINLDKIDVKVLTFNVHVCGGHVRTGMQGVVGAQT